MARHSLHAVTNAVLPFRLLAVVYTAFVDHAAVRKTTLVCAVGCAVSVELLIRKIAKHTTQRGVRSSNVDLVRRTRELGGHRDVRGDPIENTRHGVQFRGTRGVVFVVVRDLADC